jgi:hypothetical protein
MPLVSSVFFFCICLYFCTPLFFFFFLLVVCLFVRSFVCLFSSELPECSVVVVIIMLYSAAVDAAVV